MLAGASLRCALTHGADRKTGNTHVTFSLGDLTLKETAA